MMTATTHQIRTEDGTVDTHFFTPDGAPPKSAILFYMDGLGLRQALFDMAYNLGVGGLLKFRKLLAACTSGQWEIAATECHRAGIGDERNLETAALFLQAADAGTNPHAA